MKSATPIGFRSETTGHMTPLEWGNKDYFATAVMVYWMRDGHIEEAEADDVEIWSELGRVVRPGPMLMSAAKKALCEDPKLRERAGTLWAQ